jgi:hypothetical protein
VKPKPLGLSQLPDGVEKAVYCVERAQLWSGSVDDMQQAAAWFIDTGQTAKATIALSEVKRLLGDTR